MDELVGLFEGVNDWIEWINDQMALPTWIGLIRGWPSTL